MIALRLNIPPMVIIMDVIIEIAFTFFSFMTVK